MNVFQPVRPTNLAICRILVYSSLLLFVIVEAPGFFRDYGVVAELPSKFFRTTSYLRFVPIPTPTMMRVCQCVWMVALLTSAVGFCSRISTIVAGVGSVYFLCLPFQFGATGHNTVLLWYWSVIFSFTRCGDTLSVDWWMRGRPAVKSSGEYRWPIFLMQCMFAFVFFAGGLSKCAVGLEWITSDSLHRYMIRNSGYTTHQPVIADSATWLPQAGVHVMAAVALTLELSIIAAPVFLRVRQFAVPGIFLMQLGIYLFLGVHGIFWINYLMWIDWERFVGAGNEASSQ